MFPPHQLVSATLTCPAVYVPASPPLAYKFAVLSLLSPAYMIHASINCFVLFMQLTAQAFCFAALKAGNNMAARMAIMAITTSNSINVKPREKGKKRFVRREWDF